MNNLRVSFFLIVLLTVGSTSCTDLAASPTVSQPAPTFAPQIPLEVEIQQAFRIQEPHHRTQMVLAAVGRMLSEPSLLPLSDDELSLYLTEQAFASETMLVNDPAFVRRNGQQAVVGIPDGIGIYFFDLADGGVIEISPWVVGLSTVNVIWRETQVGVVYETVGVDSTHWTRFALLSAQEGAWGVRWLSDDEPDWWLNARNARLDIEPDLSLIAVVGEAEDTTRLFEESQGKPRRLFRMVWEQGENHQYYAQTPSIGYATRSDWIWAIAEPSPYATLIEFIERLQRQDANAVSHLVVNSTVTDDAASFGYYLIGVTYEIILSEPERLIVRGHQGTFEFTFVLPQSDGQPWLIASIKPTSAPTE